MKIALLSEKYTPDIGGLAISAGRLGRLLSSAGYEIRVFSPSPSLPASGTRTLTHDGVSVTRFGTRKRVDDTLVDWLDLIVKEHRSSPFDLIHAYFLPQAGLVAAYAGKYLNIPSLVSIRGNDIERAAFDPARFSHVMYALQNASAVTTNASELVKKARAFIDREIILIPNGIDTGLFKPMERNEGLVDALGLNTFLQSDTIPVIGFAGELREKKGLQTLLNGYAQLNRQKPTALLIIGEVRQGGDQQTFNELRLSIPDSKIIVTGYISHKDIPAYYALMDVFVHPSLRDGMPNALLEAMACEKAVVATSVGGATDVVQDGENGRLVAVNDVDGMVKTIAELLDDDGQRTRLGKSARKTILRGFTPEKELEANLAVYKRIMDGKSPIHDSGILEISNAKIQRKLGL